jgi:hypothetical protein
MGHTLTWVRKAGALRTDPLTGPFTFAPALEAGDEQFSIPVGTFRAMPDEYTVVGETDQSVYVPPAYTMPVYRGEPGPREWGPEDELNSAVEVAVSTGVNTGEPKERTKKERRAADRAGILKNARGGDDQRMKDWKKAANAVLADLGWDPVTPEESQKEQKRRRNRASHRRRDVRDGVVPAPHPHSPGATAGLASGAERSIQIVGGPRMDLFQGTQQRLVQDSIRQSMRGSLLN